MKFLDLVKKIEGKSDRERREIILEEIISLGYKPEIESGSYFGFPTKNIIVAIGKGKKEILVTTHYDLVLGTPGANDNSSCIAVLISLLNKLKKHKPKNKIKFIVFDKEEVGCLGSKVYIKKYGIKNIKALFNLELVGYGDMFGLWPITNINKNTKILGTLRSVIKKEGYKYEELEKLPLFFSDHRTFMEAGLKDVVCITVGPKRDSKKIKQFVSMTMAEFLIKTISKGIKPPKLLQRYHSKDDKSKYLNESAMKMTADVLYKSVIKLDKKI